jgi:putative oxidoreductase
MRPAPMNASLQRLLRPDGPGAVLFVRLAVGFVFLTEGIQKFLFPGDLGVGRFMHIGIPAPQIMAPFVGGLEIIGGLALIIGLGSRLFAVPLLIDMLVAITSTKLVTLGKNGFWKTSHEARTDLLMIAGLVLILVIGPGVRSLDRWLASRARARQRAGSAEAQQR